MRKSSTCTLPDQMVDLLFLRDDFENTCITTLDGQTRYSTHTPRNPEEYKTTRVRYFPQKKSSPPEKIARIQWRVLCTRTAIKTDYLPSDLGNPDTYDGFVDIRRLLKRQFRNKIGPNQQCFSHFFEGDDGKKYRWKSMKGVGCELTSDETGEMIAFSKMTFILEGPSAGKLLPVLRFNPNTSLTPHFILLSFLLVDEKRRRRYGPDDRWELEYGIDDPMPRYIAEALASGGGGGTGGFDGGEA